MHMTPYLVWVKLIAFLGALVSAFFFGYKYGANGVQVEWDATIQVQQAAQMQTLIDNQEVVRLANRQNTAINKKVEEDEQNRLRVLRENSVADRRSINLAGGLRIPASICKEDGVPTTAASPSEHNETVTGTRQLPRQIEDDLFNSADSADEIVEQLRAAQEWIRKSGLYQD